MAPPGDLAPLLLNSLLIPCSLSRRQLLSERCRALASAPAKPSAKPMQAKSVASARAWVVTRKGVCHGRSVPRPSHGHFSSRRWGGKSGRHSRPVSRLHGNVSLDRAECARHVLRLTSGSCQARWSSHGLPAALAPLCVAPPEYTAKKMRSQLPTERSRPTNFCRNLATLGATTIWQYGCCGLLAKYSW